MGRGIWIAPMVRGWSEMMNSPLTALACISQDVVTEMVKSAS